MEDNKFKCNECKKYYKSYQSIWNHKKKFHPQLPTNDPQIDKIIPTIHPQNIHNIKIKKTDQTECIYCNKQFSCYNSMNRHIQKCKNKQNIIKENEELKNKTKQQEQQILNIEKKLDNITNKMEEIINKTSTELINMTNNTTNNGTINNTSNNNSNNTITNNINIFKLGSETILENLPKEKQLCILRMPEYKALLEAIRITHFDKDHPEGHNWYNSNLRENFVIVYDKENNKSMRDYKEDVVDFVIQQRINELEELGDKHKYELNDTELNNIDYIVKTDYPPHISEKVKIMAHQNKDIVSKTLNKVSN
jgi:hypothetical protein